MARITSKTILFITGAFIDHRCWDNWKQFFHHKGYRVIVAPWPAKDADAETLRGRHPDPVLAAVTIRELISYYAAIIHGLPETPIVIGHSFGGLLTQILLNRDLAAAGIAIHSVPPRGVIAWEPRFYLSNTAALGLFTDISKTYLMPFKSWRKVFTNGMPFEDQQESYYDHCIPESKRAIRGGLGPAAKVNFKKPHEPLLIVAGSNDHCIPWTLNRRNFRAYQHKGSVTDFIVKPRNHYVLGLPTWEDDASEILEWIKNH
ncbi:Pimeloyl-ACP methyl ester carboxylesterase [Chitinophaga jiangningensis]|uniref:Pimeloyl-ACP methyl ester carboxylesterase n=1 Tax=Chitinophaga jiangningensis TaxID=1419482 RepID=A0A1M6Z113_9BACT|nr:alpha/beta hydrolase [Chitinophaga jiangningensis]SHL24052.1 Pimeloyl-ACP methyl ester carboxylesterase [Chitinophaga jiangningensis]